MARFSHGDELSPVLTGPMAAAAKPKAGRSFDFMFKGLSAPGDKLPVSPGTVAGLMTLGARMDDDILESPAQDSQIPAAYTYFGQFLDHDITLQSPGPGVADISDPNLTPMANPAADFTNLRDPVLDLDCLYGGLAARDPANPNKLLVGKTMGQNSGKGAFNDLPRRPPHSLPELDREALIGDPRNDENLVLAQLHLAFIRAHNALIDQGKSLKDAVRIMRENFQRIVMQDFLPRTVDAAVLNDVLTNGPKFFKANSMADMFVPFEFAVAAYRLGHSMIRGTYDYNDIFPNATLDDLFTFTALSGNLGGPTLPGVWVIDWDRFLPLSSQPSQVTRRFDTRLTNPLKQLKRIDGSPEPPPKSSLAVRNLLRGYLIGLPTGQAVAGAMGLTPLKGPSLLAASHPSQHAVLQANGFDQQTPLWFYILAEAGNPAGPNGLKMGPVGSRIVVETFWNMVNLTPASIIKPGGKIKGDPFTLADLIKLSGNGA